MLQFFEGVWSSPNVTLEFSQVTEPLKNSYF